MQPKSTIFEGKTLDDAVKKGLESLGMSRADVMITVMEEGSGGFLGLGARPYRVRMMPRPARESQDRPARAEGGRSRGAERGGRGPERSSRGPERGERGSRGGSDRGRRGGREERPARTSGDAARRPSRGERPPSSERRHPGDRRELHPEARSSGDERREGDDRRGAEVADGRRDEGGPERAGRGRRSRRGGRGRSGGAPVVPGGLAEPQIQAVGSEAMPGESPARVETAAEREVETQATTHFDGPALSGEELVASGRQLTEDLLKAMGFDAKVTAQAAEANVDVTAEIADGEDLLTGRKGEVRQALQHLLNRMVNHGGGSRYHLQLEINDFWRRREDQLVALARELAEEATSSGSERLTEYLNAQERRVVHVTLREDPRVKTYAIGDGLIKKVAVAPADYPEGQKTNE